MRFTRKRITVLAILFGIAGLAFFYTAYRYHYRWKWAVASYKRQLASRGELVDIRQLLPTPLPDETNGVGIFREAALHLSRRGQVLDRNPPVPMRIVGPGKAAVTHLLAELRDDRTNNSWAELETELAGSAKGITIIRGLEARPALDFGLDYREGFTLMLPHLANLKQSSSRLSQAMVLALHRGEIDAAAEDLRLQLILVRSFSGERLVISQLVRYSMAQIAFASTWEFLHASGTDARQLAAIQQEWEKLDLLPDWENALVMERAMGIMTIDEMLRSTARFRSMAGLAGGPGGVGSSATGFAQAGEVTLQYTAARAMEIQWRWLWAYRDQYKALQGGQALIEAARDCRKDGRFDHGLARQRERLAKLEVPADPEGSGFFRGPGGGGLKGFFSESLLSLQTMANRALMVENCRQLAIAALGLERYRLKHGGYPESLAALAPEFAQSLPRDPMDGQPLRYRREANGDFLLYAISVDGKDDGGKAESARTDGVRKSSFGAGSWQGGRDLVWPRVATAEEIAASYAKSK